MTMNNTAIKLAGLILSGILACGGVIFGFGNQYGRIKANVKGIETVKEDGCDPARENVTAVRVIESRQKTFQTTLNKIETTQSDMRKESNDAFQRILERLP